MPASSHSERHSSSPLAPPPAKQVPGGFSMLTVTCMQRGESRAAVMVVQGAAVGPVFARRRCRTEPASSHSERRNSSPATPPYAEQSPGSCPRPRPVPLHQEPGSERSSSRARGRTWPATAPPAAPMGALALLRAPLLVPSGASVRGKKLKKMP